MTMPQFPEVKNRPSLKETVIDLLESIAVEETAIANIIRAEAKKISAFLGEKGNFPTNPSNVDIVNFNQGISRILETVLMKEWILLKKLETVLQIDSSYFEGKKDRSEAPNPAKKKKTCDKRQDISSDFGGNLDWFDDEDMNGEE